MTMLYLHGMLPSSPIQRKQAIKKLFEMNPEGVLPINNKYQIHLKYDKDLQKLIKDGFLNQIRQKIGVFFGNPETTTGGNALKFYASVRLDVRRSTTAVNSVMSGDVKIGNETTVKVIKNKVAPPFTSAKFDILYGQGIDRVGELIDVALDKEILKKSGSWFSYNNENIGQGREAIRQLLLDNESLAKEIESKI